MSETIKIYKLHAFKLVATKRIALFEKDVEAYNLEQAVIACKKIYNKTEYPSDEWMFKLYLSDNKTSIIL